LSLEIAGSLSTEKIIIVASGNNFYQISFNCETKIAQKWWFWYDNYYITTTHHD